MLILYDINPVLDYSTPGLHYKIPVFSDPAPGKSWR